MNKYLEMKRRHQKEVNNFPMMFAFNNKQFKEGMEKLGLTIDDTDKIYYIGGGGYIRKKDSKDFGDMLSRHNKEFNEAIEKDITGEGFIYDMFLYELGNHEYGYTLDATDTLEALGFTFKEVMSKDNLKNGFEKARIDALKEYKEHN